ncbi:MAG TPA: DoxX family protein [Bryobacteraceae bacterium]|nr:DoxX family protein [Bryobacteraceae bacterium]
MCLQRLFSTFPDGWPGLGLLLLRLGIGIALIWLGLSGFWETLGETSTTVRNLVAAAGGILLVAGLWTPLIGILLAVDQLWIALSLYRSQREEQWIHVLFVVLTVGVAMLGPGAWSIDARLFGRKRFDI